MHDMQSAARHADSDDDDDDDVDESDEAYAALQAKLELRRQQLAVETGDCSDADYEAVQVRSRVGRAGASQTSWGHPTRRAEGAPFLSARWCAAAQTNLQRKRAELAAVQQAAAAATATAAEADAAEAEAAEAEVQRAAAAAAAAAQFAT
jgi:hypothetical protein